MRSKLCFIVCGVILAVTIGQASNISAYTYSGMVAEAEMDHGRTHPASGGSWSVSELMQEVTGKDTELAVREASVHLQMSGYEGEITPSAQMIMDNDNDTQRLSQGAEEYHPYLPVNAEDNISSTGEMGRPWDTFPSIKEDPYGDIAVLCQIVMAEAGNEDLIGQIMVANVILNRVKAGIGESVYDVVFQYGQFDPVATGSYYRVVPSDSVKEAVYRALNGEDYSQGALFFCCGFANEWFEKNLKFVTVHGNHFFYKY